MDRRQESHPHAEVGERHHRRQVDRLALDQAFIADQRLECEIAAHRPARGQREGSERVLAALGFADDEIERLKKTGVVGG